VLLIFVWTSGVFFGFFLYLDDVEQLIGIFGLVREMLVTLKNGLDFTLVLLFLETSVHSRADSLILIIRTAIRAAFLTVVSSVGLSVLIFEYFQVLLNRIYLFLRTFLLALLLLIFLVPFVKKHLVDSVL
jgi:hypothetical protein